MRKMALIVLMAVMIPLGAFAVDGVVLINQSTVLNSGGFPYRITQTGSYKLTGNLVVPLNQVGILISASNVVLDLNGFNIQCSADQNLVAALFSFGCISSTTVHNIAVRNGTITASASAPTLNFSLQIDALQLFNSTFDTVENLQIEVNTTNFFGHAINTGLKSIIRHNILSGNQGGTNRQCPSLFEGNINVSAGGGGGGSGCVFVNNIGIF